MRLEIIYLEYDFHNCQILFRNIVFDCVSLEADAETKSEYKQFIWEAVSAGDGRGGRARREAT